MGETKAHILPPLEVEHTNAIAARHPLKIPPLTPMPSPPPPSAPHLLGHRSVVIDKTLSSAANLMKLLPSGSLLAFQALCPSFTNNGVCTAANRYLTTILIAVSTISCIFFSFTDSFKGRDGKVYYGIATTKGLLIFNDEEKQDEEARNWWLRDLSRFRIKWVDYVHAVFSVLVFMAVAISDSNVQDCFFSDADPNNHALLVNLPLGIGFLSAMVFLIFPTTRRGIGYSDSAH